MIPGTRSFYQNQTMSPISISSFLLLFLASAAAAASVEETCRSIAAARQYVAYDFCVGSLESDPDSASADALALAVVATRLSAANATRVASKIESMAAAAAADPSLRECLSACAEVYSDAIDRLGQAVASIESRAYRDAVTFLSAALDAADNCEEAFGDLGLTSPLAAEDRDYGWLADIALAITASLG